MNISLIDSVYLCFLILLILQLNQGFSSSQLQTCGTSSFTEHFSYRFCLFCLNEHQRTR
jgi:hypothetical protein